MMLAIAHLILAPIKVVLALRYVSLEVGSTKINPFLRTGHRKLSSGV
jgi:hypothetical protein